jgi:hypothetical protein
MSNYGDSICANCLLSSFAIVRTNSGAMHVIKRKALEKGRRESLTKPIRRPLRNQLTSIMVLHIGLTCFINVADNTPVALVANCWRKRDIDILRVDSKNSRILLRAIAAELEPARPPTFPVAVVVLGRIDSSCQSEKDDQRNSVSGLSHGGSWKFYGGGRRRKGESVRKTTFSLLPFCDSGTENRVEAVCIYIALVSGLLIPGGATVSNVQSHFEGVPRRFNPNASQVASSLGFEATLVADRLTNAVGY